LMIKSFDKRGLIHNKKMQNLKCILRIGGQNKNLKLKINKFLI
jgi:hypothetical protein